MHKKHTAKSLVKYLSIQQEEAGQRLDNFLITKLKGVPKSRIYRLVRKGEVRVNKKRTSVFYRLQAGDSLRLPPLYLPEKAQQAPPSEATAALLTERILYEDDYLLVLNKPAGMSVHAGSTVRVGVVEALRFIYPKLKHLELAHRLDSETSGCLILAKKRSILRELHTLLREGKISKIYWAITKGEWRPSELRVDLPLLKEYRQGGQHLVSVHAEGKAALSVFKTLKSNKNLSLVEVNLHTGRTHQIRVHAKHQKHPILGDDRYGDPDFNQMARALGHKKMFLHARSVDFILPSLERHITVVAPLDPEWQAGITHFFDTEV